MSQGGKDQIKLVNLDAPWRRALLAVPLALVLAGAWFAARWCLGNTLAYGAPDEATALAAERLAPADPQVHYTLAVLARKSFAPEELEEALRRYERAAELSPHDYRLWMDLGRVRGQTGDAEGGERALRRAVQLAPHYSLPRWYLGNLLLRAGKTDEAFAELARAAEIDPELHPQVYNAAWSFFRGDADRVARAVGDAPESRARLVAYLAQQKRADEALRLWSGIDAARKPALGAEGRVLLTALIEAGRFRAALDLYREIAPGQARALAVGHIHNGGFESEVTTGAGGNPFDWVIRPTGPAPMSLDPRQRRGGARSLRVTFNAPGNFTFGNFSQLVPAEGQTRYRLTYFFRTEGLKSVSTLQTVVQATDGRLLAGSAAVPAGTNDWQQISLDFTTPPRAEAVTVSVVRQVCSEEVCPIFGRVWYDDFSLQRAGG